MAAILIGIAMWRNTKKRKLQVNESIWQAGEGAVVQELTDGLPSATTHRHDLVVKHGLRMPKETQEGAGFQDPAIDSSQPGDPYNAVAAAKRKLTETLLTKWQIGGNDHAQVGQLLQARGLATDKATDVEQALRQTDAWLYSPYREMTDAVNILTALDASVSALNGKLL